MTRAAAPHIAPPAPGRSPGDGLGMAVFVAWLLLAISGFWNLIVLPMQAQAALAQDPGQRALVERWARDALALDDAARSGLPAAEGSAIVLADPVACGCVAPTALSLAERLRAAGIAVVDLPRDAARLAQRPEVTVLGADGRLRYAGPAMPSLFCASGRTLAESAVSGDADSAAALVLPAECRCDEGSTVSTDGHATPST